MRKGRLKLLKEYANELKWVRDEIVKIEEPFVTIQGHEFKIGRNHIKREQIYKNGNDGSAVIIVPQDRKTKEFLVTIEPRVFTAKKIAVGFPAGYIEKDEKPQDAALRELREETGYVPEKIIHLDAFYQDEGISAAYNHIFLALNCEKKYDQDLDKDEMIKYMTFTYNELLELEEMGYISGSNSKLALLRIRK